MTDYDQFFEKATGYEPYDYQVRLASEGAGDRLLSVPTGAGKTAAVIVAWLWWIQRGGPEVSRRLVYCLPMRTLTLQTAAVARTCAKNVGLDERIGIYVLMGGGAEEDESWQMYPERPALIVGTQDMILSRLLNRGYAMNPLRWPVAFGLLANDATWVFDEVQLLGDGLATSLQLQGLRKKLGAFGNCHSIWMSATCRPEWLETVDHGGLAEAAVIGLSEKDRRQLEKRLTAKKALERAPEVCRTPEGLAKFVLGHHQAGTLTLVVVNTVARAVETYGALEELKPIGGPAIELLHSRYRPVEREAKASVLSDGGGEAGRILVATQVIEAGVDISAALMVTDIAPYSSLVQRVGRVNRAGEYEQARVYWVDRPVSGKLKKLADKAELKDKEQDIVARPYSWDELERSRRTIEELMSASPADLPEIREGVEFGHVLRRRDLMDLFDTTPDLGGNDVDVSRFIRTGEERDVFVAWREWADAESRPEKELERLAARELCSVPLGQFREFLPAAKVRAWTWRPGLSEWEAVEPERLAPGMRVVLHTSAGGYTEETGWTPESKAPVRPVVITAEGQPEESVDDDPLTERPRRARYRQSLRAHTDRVVQEAEAIWRGACAGRPEEYGRALLLAARLHDWGKAHPEFQTTLQPDEAPWFAEMLAKSCRMGRHARRHLRHELASALAVLEGDDDEERDLVGYLVAAHHGRIRLTLRSMPDEREENLMRGIYDGDRLPTADLGGGVVMPETVLRLGVAGLGSEGDGRRSWGERMTRLRDEVGPFRLAYLEALLRAADERASAEPGKECEACPE